MADLFKFNNVTQWRSGEAINGWDNLVWTERYRDPGEFELKCQLSSGLRELLPLGSLISHSETLEIMIVENHQISEDEEKSPVLTITGRSLEAFLEHRMVGQNQNWTTQSPTLITIELAADYTWFQAMDLINMHIVSGNTMNAGDALTLIGADTTIVGTSVQEARVIKRGNLHERVLEILEIDDLGIKVERSNEFPGPFPGPYTTLHIYLGEDRRNTVVFSAQTGDISSADYLWSLKKYKNAALVTGKFVETMVYGSETGINRRVMFVDGSDIDGALTEVPIGTELSAIRNAMAIRGRQALKAQKEVVLSRTDISENQSYRYRIDYNVGDIVAIDGSFGETVPMRVVEYAHIEDENGESGHPTLSVLEPTLEEIIEE